MRIWTVKLKRTASSSQGLIEGLTVSVTTQQNCHDYPSPYGYLSGTWIWYRKSCCLACVP